MGSNLKQISCGVCKKDISDKTLTFVYENDRGVKRDDPKTWIPLHKIDLTGAGQNCQAIYDTEYDKQVGYADIPRKEYFSFRTKLDSIDKKWFGNDYNFREKVNFYGAPLLLGAAPMIAMRYLGFHDCPSDLVAWIGSAMITSVPIPFFWAPLNLLCYAAGMYIGQTDADNLRHKRLSAEKGKAESRLVDLINK